MARGLEESSVYTYLISHTSKVLLKIIEGRMESGVKKEILDVQVGFRRRSGTRDQIENVRWLIERARVYNQPVFLCFIYYSKASDCVDNNILWKTLRSMGFQEHYIELLRNLYKNLEDIVRTKSGDTMSLISERVCVR